MPTGSERNKEAVRRFNLEVVQGGDRPAFESLVAPGFVNRPAPPGAEDGPESMGATFQNVLRPALPDLRVEILDQVAEGDRATTRKAIVGTHRGERLGVPATGRAVRIDVIDVVRLEEGRYAEHRGVHTLPSVLAGLRQGWAREREK